MVLPQYMSYAVNLYDEIAKTLDYTLKVKIDKILTESTKPYEVSVQQTNLRNTNGLFVEDVVGTVLAIQSKSDTDRAYVDSQDELVVNSVAFESQTRESADNALQSAVDSEVASRIAAVGLEVANRSAADTVIQMNLDAETSARIASDSTMAATMTTKETNIYSTITTNKNNIETALASEVSDRTSSVSSEQSARESADSTLSGRIDQEATDRASAVTEQKLRIDALLSGTGVNLDQLQELVTAYTSLNTDALAQVATLLTAHTQLQADFTDLKTRFDAITTTTP